MNATFNRSFVLRLLAGFGFLFGFLIVCAELFAPTLFIELSPADGQYDDGFAYIVPLSTHLSLVYKLRFDGKDGNESTLVLYEQGRPLGPAHSTHDEIRREGAGRFSHWGTALWLSSSDGTDPRTNGRSYVAQTRLSVRTTWMRAAAVLLGAALLFVAFEATRTFGGRRWRLCVAELQRFVVALTRPSGHGAACTLIIAVVGVVMSAGAVIYGWYEGDTSLTGLGVARFFPVSDAFGYHSCATSIGAAGKFDEPFGDAWCARRALYPSMLASILGLAAWSSQLALIIQGALVGMAVATFALALSSITGRLAALLAVALLSLYAWEFVLGLFMTEVLGFTLGLFGLTLLLGFCQSQRTWLLLVGAAFVSIALAARAGALFVLPAIPIWAALAFPTSQKIERVRLSFIALAGVLAGPLLQFVILSLLGADATNTGGNFSATLYGLSTGSRDWSQAYREFEALFRQGESVAFQHIYQVAWQNIRENPAVFVRSLLEAGHLYFISLFSFVAVLNVNTLLTALAALGVARCVFELQRPMARLIVALAIAEIVAAPLIIDSGGTRVFAVTVPVRILLCTLGLQWILQFACRVIAGGATFGTEASDATPSWVLAAATGAALVILIIAPATPLAMMARFQRTTGLGCPSGLKEVVAHLGKESQTFTIVGASAAVESIEPFRIAPERLLADSRLPTTWFGKDFLGLSPPYSIIRAVDLSSPTASAVKPLAFAGQLPDNSGIQSLCVDESVYVNIAEVRHYLIKQIRPLSERH